MTQVFLLNLMRLIIVLNIWWPVLLFSDIDFIYRYSMEVDKENIFTYIISVGVACGFVG